MCPTPVFLLTGRPRTVPVIRNCFLFVEWTCRPNFPKPSGLYLPCPKAIVAPSSAEACCKHFLAALCLCSLLRPRPTLGSTDSWLWRGFLHWYPGSLRQWLVEAKAPVRSPDLTFVWFTESKQVAPKAVLSTDYNKFVVHQMKRLPGVYAPVQRDASTAIQKPAAREGKSSLWERSETAGCVRRISPCTQEIRHQQAHLDGEGSHGLWQKGMASESQPRAGVFPRGVV